MTTVQIYNTNIQFTQQSSKSRSTVLHTSKCLLKLDPRYCEPILSGNRGIHACSELLGWYFASHPVECRQSRMCVFPACLSCGVLWSPGLCVVLVWFSCSESFPFKHICGLQSKPPMLPTPLEVTPKALSSVWPPVRVHAVNIRARVNARLRRRLYSQMSECVNACAIHCHLSSGVLAKAIPHVVKIIASKQD